MAKAPRPGSTRNTDPLRLVITVDGDRHVFCPDALTARQIGECRRQVGRTVRSLLAEVATDADIDTLAAFVWLAKLQRGERVDYATVADAITYDADFGVETNAVADAEDDSPEDDSPEA